MVFGRRLRSVEAARTVLGGFWFSESKIRLKPTVPAQCRPPCWHLAIRNYAYIQARCSSTNFVVTTGAMASARASATKRHFAARARHSGATGGHLVVTARLLHEKTSGLLRWNLATA